MTDQSDFPKYCKYCGEEMEYYLADSKNFDPISGVNKKFILFQCSKMFLWFDAPCIVLDRIWLDGSRCSWSYKYSRKKQITREKAIAIVSYSKKISDGNKEESDRMEMNLDDDFKKMIRQAQLSARTGLDDAGAIRPEAEIRSGHNADRTVRSGCHPEPNLSDQAREKNPGAAEDGGLPGGSRVQGHGPALPGIRKGSE